jgi:hypothetical protein
MKISAKLRTAVLATTLVAATVPLSTSADAAWRGGWGWGGFGVGLAAGALIGGALAAPYYGGYYAYDPGYNGYYAPAYYAYAPGPAYSGGYWGGGPYIVHRRHWRHWHHW